MNKLHLLALAVTLSFIFLSCKSTQSALNQSDLNGKWVLKTFDGKSAESLFSNETPTLDFDFEKHTISGKGDCNRYSGGFKYENGVFSVPNNLITTMMFCLRQDSEDKYFAVFNQPSHLSVKDGQLIFVQNKKNVAVFERVKNITEKELQGTWTLESLEGSTANVFFTENVPTLKFDFENNRIGGFAGCNTYGAAFALKDNKLTIEKAFSTRMACMNGMEGEQKYLTLLSGEFDLELSNGNLTLTRNGIHVATFSRG